MKIIILLCSLMFWNISISQNIIELPKFQSIESNIEASIEIVKSKESRIEILNQKKHNEFLDWQVLDDKLTLKVKEQYENLDLKNILITIYTSNIQELVITNRADISMSSTFSTMNTLSVISENGANVDLTNIVFNTLIIYKDSESDIKYKSVNTLINNKKPHKY
ncbi:DUF2807 domain-containing protein [uncultured Dokdonia sp.]|uniref:GIN domain-containing protein n=1 Tax=uncultured Dokdonia sp. TaxID=575653 RepID=UPI0026249C2F|nr:DUF2807 domain-containing protein [uncultured Dokdonia sp.]